MPTLIQTLPANDLGFLRIAASLWGIELSSNDPAEAAVELAEALCDAELLEEIISTLPDQGQLALAALVESGGRMPWVAFTRRFGDVREMGAGKRDREQPHLRPNSAAEMLWYRSLLARKFFDAPGGAQEFALIPDDILEALGFIGFGAAQDAEEETSAKPAPAADVPLGRPASPGEKAHIIPFSDGILDDITTLLAALRMGVTPPPMGIPTPVLTALIMETGLVKDNVLQPEPVKGFLESPRGVALEQLANVWRESESLNELRQIPGLVFEGGWTNEPLVTREFLLNLLDDIPENNWWSLAAFVRDVKARYPDFQRPAGDYDSWFVKRESDGIFLRGFAHWDDVDGALIRYFISGPLFWLGQVGLAAGSDGGTVTAFQLCGDGDGSQITGQKPGDLRPVSFAETGKLIVSSNGSIVVPRLVPRVARYQVARFCVWDEPKNDDYRYRVTTDSLKRARVQGLKTEQLINILRRHASAPLPPAFVRALKRWEANGTEARIETLTVLKFTRPEVLNELKASKAARFLGETIGPTTIVIKIGAVPKVLAVLAEMGLLAEIIENQSL